MVIPFFHLGPVLRDCYPELRNPYAWYETFRQWFEAEPDPWRKGVLEYVFQELWKRGTFHGLAPVTEGPNVLDRVRAEELGH